MSGTSTTTKTKLGWGALGGFFSTTIPLAFELTGSTANRLPEINAGYVLGLLLFMGIGAIWNLMLDGHNSFVGVYHGATARLVLVSLCHIIVPQPHDKLPAESSPAPSGSGIAPRH